MYNGWPNGLERDIPIQMIFHILQKVFFLINSFIKIYLIVIRKTYSLSTLYRFHTRIKACDIGTHKSNGHSFTLRDPVSNK